MPPIHLLLTLLFVLAAASLVWWGISRMAVPEPFKTVVLVIVGLVLLYWLWGAFAGHVS